ncbi:hypothetical protein [Mycobacteroides abscessus]
MSKNTERPSKIIEVQDYYEQDPDHRTVGVNIFAYGAGDSPAFASVQVQHSYANQSVRLSVDEIKKLINGLQETLAFIDSSARKEVSA